MIFLAYTTITRFTLANTMNKSRMLSPIIKSPAEISEASRHQHGVA